MVHIKKKKLKKKKRIVLGSQLFALPSRYLYQSGSIGETEPIGDIY